MQLDRAGAIFPLNTKNQTTNLNNQQSYFPGEVPTTPAFKAAV